MKEDEEMEREDGRGMAKRPDPNELDVSKWEAHSTHDQGGRRKEPARPCRYIGGAGNWPKSGPVPPGAPENGLAAALFKFLGFAISHAILGTCQKCGRVPG
jgi:hypothetical protein